MYVNFHIINYNKNTIFNLYTSSGDGTVTYMLLYLTLQAVAFLSRCTSLTYINVKTCVQQRILQAVLITLYAVLVTLYAVLVTLYASVTKSAI